VTRDPKKDPPLDTPRRVAELTAELEAANRELEAFSYSVAHDLRAPLRHIDGFARMALEKSHGLDDALIKQLSAVVQAAGTMGKMIDGLLTLSRVGSAGLQRRPVDMAALLEKARSQLGPDAARPTPALEIGALPTASGDPELLQLVWINCWPMPSNTRHGISSRKLRVGAQTADDGKAVFFVRDNGVGFDMRYGESCSTYFSACTARTNSRGRYRPCPGARRVIEPPQRPGVGESRINGGATFYFSIGPESLGKRKGVD